MKRIRRIWEYRSRGTGSYILSRSWHERPCNTLTIVFMNLFAHICTLHTPFYTCTLPVCSSNTSTSQFCNYIHAFVDADLHSGLLNLYYYCQSFLFMLYLLQSMPYIITQASLTTHCSTVHTTVANPIIYPPDSCSSQSAWAIIASYLGSPPIESLGTRLEL